MVTRLPPPPWLVPETLMIRISLRISFGILWCPKSFQHHTKFGPDNWPVVPKGYFPPIECYTENIYIPFYGAERFFGTIQISKLVPMLMRIFTHPFGQFLISTLFGRFVEKEVRQSLDRASPFTTYPGYTLILFFHITIKYYFLE